MKKKNSKSRTDSFLIKASIVGEYIRLVWFGLVFLIIILAATLLNYPFWEIALFIIVLGLGVWASLRMIKLLRQAENQKEITKKKERSGFRALFQDYKAAVVLCAGLFVIARIAGFIEREPYIIMLIVCALLLIVPQLYYSFKTRK